MLIRSKISNYISLGPIYIMVSQLAPFRHIIRLASFHISFTFVNIHWFYQPKNILWTVPHELCSESLCSFLYYPVTSSSWCPDFLLAVFRWKQQTKVQTINKNRGKIIVHRLCGLVVRVSGYRYRGLGFDSQRCQIFWVAVGLERGTLSLVRSIEELLE
jgi:hypothetical protein